MTQQLQRVDFDTAKLLANKGFDWECTEYFHTEHDETGEGDLDNYNSEPETISRPTVAHVIMWLREVKGVHINTDCSICHTAWYGFAHNKDTGLIVAGDGPFDTCDLAESAALLHALKLIK